MRRLRTSSTAVAYIDGKLWLVCACVGMWWEILVAQSQPLPGWLVTVNSDWDSVRCVMGGKGATIKDWS